MTGRAGALWRGEGWWRQPRVAFEELDQHIKASQAVLAGGLEVAADSAEGFGPGQCPEAAAYLVVQFGHPEVALALVIVKAHGRVGPVALHFVALVPEPAQQVVGVPVDAARPVPGGHGG